MPVVAAGGGGRDEARLLVVVALRGLHRPPGLEVDVARPGDGHVGLGRDELSGLAVEDVEEAVLRGVQQRLALSPADLEVREQDVLDRGVVPVVARCRLVVPGELAGVRTQREDRAQEEIVSAAGAAVVARPGGAVADADVEQVELGIEGHRVPGGAAAADSPPLPGPGLGRHLELGMLERLGRVPGDGVEAPDLLAASRVVGGDVATDSVLGAAVADDDLSLDHAGSAGDGVGGARGPWSAPPRPALRSRRRARPAARRALRRRPCLPTVRRRG